MDSFKKMLGFIIGKVNKWLINFFLFNVNIFYCYILD